MIVTPPLPGWADLIQLLHAEFIGTVNGLNGRHGAKGPPRRSRVVENYSPGGSMNRRLPCGGPVS